jgi:hypothetical protein
MPSQPLIAPELEDLAVPIESLKLWPRNPRQGDVGAIAESLKRFGQVRPILVQKATSRIVAGNHLYRAATALGWTEIAAVVTDMSDKQAKAYVAADNRVAELGSFDDELLAVLLADIAKTDTLEGTGYDEDDLADLLSKVGKPAGGAGHGDPDGSFAVPDSPWVTEGQAFQMGPHRLMCARPDPQAVAKLLGDDKPKLLIVQDAPKPQDAAMLWETLADIQEQFWFRPEAYDFLTQLGPEALHKGSLLVWDKQSQNTSRDYVDAFELIFSREHHKADILRFTLIGAADGDAHGGPDFTERPTALFQDIYERWSRFEDVVFDPFALGASSLLAAERTARAWYGMKKDPAHVQALLEKWSDFTGQEAEEIT